MPPRRDSVNINDLRSEAEMFIQRKKSESDKSSLRPNNLLINAEGYPELMKPPQSISMDISAQGGISLNEISLINDSEVNPTPMKTQEEPTNHYPEFSFRPTNTPATGYAKRESRRRKFVSQYANKNLKP